MSYIGNNLQVAYPSYTNIDDISGSFNGVTTSFALTVGGVAPVPAPLSSNQCMISVGGVIQRPDDTGTEGFRLSGGNIVFSSAPNTGEDFFGVILAGADYVNVGVNYPSGSASTPSITFDTDLDTGIYNPGANEVGITTGGTSRLIIDSSGNVAVDTNTLYVDATNNRVGIGTTSPLNDLHLHGQTSGVGPVLNLTNDTGDCRVFFGQNTSVGSANAAGQIRYSVANNTMAFYTNLNERARIDSSGRLLVGTSSSTDTALLIVQGNTSGSTLAGVINIAVGTATPASGGALGFVRFSDSGNSEAATIAARRDGGTWSASSKPSRLEFSTTANGASSPTERMRIFSDGNARFSNLTDVYPQTDNAVRLGASGLRWSQVWAANGTIQTSDERAKSEITTSTLGSDFIKSLRPVSYKWIEGGKVDTGERDEDGNYIYESVPGQRTHWGFIAQEVKQAIDAAGVDFGGWVLTDKDDPDSQQALRYDQFIAPLTKALQETMAELEALKAEVATLKAQ